MAAVSAATVALRRRVIAALTQAGGDVSTPELCTLAGFNNFEHHAHALPQLRALARAGVVIRTPGAPGRALYWRLNASDQADAELDARLNDPRDFWVDG